MILHTKSQGSPKSFLEAPRKLQKNSGQKSRNNFVGFLVQTMTPKGHFEINWPLDTMSFFLHLLPIYVFMIIIMYMHPGLPYFTARYFFKVFFQKFKIPGKLCKLFWQFAKFSQSSPSSFNKCRWPSFSQVQKSIYFLPLNRIK